MSRTRTRWRLSLTATALLAASFLVPAPVNAAAEGTTAEDVTAEDTTDYAITVDPRTAGAKIDDTMYGVFFEDINRAADGGLYAELVQNRSFEYSKADNGSYTSLTSWATTGAAKTADDDGRLNARNRTYLTLDGGSSVTNSGYNTGISVEKGKVYDFSVWARAEGRSALTVTLQDADGELAEARRVTARGGWAKYTARFTATRTSATGRLAVAAGSSAALDMISLIPRDTYKGHGLRKDLAQKIAALDPAFVRFPGGCLVNTGSMQDYSEASNWERKRSYQW